MTSTSPSPRGPLEGNAGRGTAKPKPPAAATGGAPQERATDRQGAGDLPPTPQSSSELAAASKRAWWLWGVAVVLWLLWMAFLVVTALRAT
jgi:hypothetical protein